MVAKIGIDIIKKASTSALMSLSSKAVSKMTYKELRAGVQKMASAFNKRIARMQAQGVYSPAAFSAEKFSTKGKNADELRTEWLRAKIFYQNPTATVKGAREYTKWLNWAFKEMGDIPPDFSTDDMATIQEKLDQLKSHIWYTYRGYVSSDQLVDEIDKFDRGENTYEQLLKNLDDASEGMRYEHDLLYKYIEAQQFTYI